MLSSLDIAWCGGFMSADGCFSWNGGSRGKGGSPMVSVSQVRQETVKKFADIFGVSVRRNDHKSAKGGEVWVSQIYGPKAIGVMLTLYTYLSTPKREDVDRVVSKWINMPSRGAVNANKTHCKHGHEYTEENTYHKKSGGRECRTCQKEYSRRYEQRKKLNS